MRDNGGTKPCLVGENTARQALLNDLRKGESRHPADCRLKGKDILENECKRPDDRRHVGKNNDERKHDKEQGHKGHQNRADSADAFDAAENDECKHDGNDDPDDQTHDLRVHRGQCARDRTGNFVGLRTAHADCRQRAKYRRHHTQNFPDDAQNFAPLIALGLHGQTFAQVIHGSACKVTAGGFFTEIHTQHVLEKVGDHAEEGGNPHPEHRAGPARHNGGSDADDIPRAYRARNGGCKRLEGGNGIFLSLLFFRTNALKRRNERLLDRRFELPHLHEPRAHGEQDARTKYENYHRPAPYDAVDEGVYLLHHFQKNFPSYLSSIDRIFYNFQRKKNGMPMHSVSALTTLFSQKSYVRVSVLLPERLTGRPVLPLRHSIE